VAQLGASRLSERHVGVSQNHQLALVRLFSVELSLVGSSEVDHAAPFLHLLNRGVFHSHVANAILEVVSLNNASHCATIYQGKHVELLVNETGRRPQHLLLEASGQRLPRSELTNLRPGRRSRPIHVI
jgi:hypothetical protein